MRQHEICFGLVERAAAAGYDTLMFTGDTPVAGARLRDRRNGFSIPPQLTTRTIVDALARPATCSRSASWYAPLSSRPGSAGTTP